MSANVAHEHGSADARTHISHSPRLLYAVGDVHGRLDLLERAAEVIQHHLAGREGKVVFLGDYVDRGPDSYGVVDFLMTAQAEGAVECLRGNHEDIMLSAMTMADPTCDMMWMGNGGGATLASYGGNVPEAHLAWMRSLPVMCSDGHRLYVHAGVMPNLPADQQDEQTCMWIREKFLRAGADELPMHVVHGHTPQWAGKPDASKPELLPHRTNLDTAAFHTGVLSVGVFDPDQPGGPLEVLTVTLGCVSSSRPDSTAPGSNRQADQSNGPSLSIPILEGEKP